MDVCNRLLLLLLRAGDDPSANFYSYVSVDPFFNVSHLEDACFALDVEIFVRGPSDALYCQVLDSHFLPRLHSLSVFTSYY